MPYPSDLTDDQWELLEPVLNAPGKRGRKHADDLRRRRWSRNSTWARGPDRAARGRPRGGRSLVRFSWVTG